MLCVPEVLFVAGVVGPLYAARFVWFTLAHFFCNERGTGLLIWGDASYCFVDCWAVAPAMQSSEPEELHCVMHLGVQRQVI